MFQIRIISKITNPLFFIFGRFHLVCCWKAYKMGGGKNKRNKRRQNKNRNNNNTNNSIVIVSIFIVYFWQDMMGSKGEISWQYNNIFLKTSCYESRNKSNCLHKLKIEKHNIVWCKSFATTVIFVYYRKCLICWLFLLFKIFVRIQNLSSSVYWFGQVFN